MNDPPADSAADALDDLAPAEVASAAPVPTEKPPQLTRAAGMISAATMLSRVLGLIRVQLFAALLGASLFADAFNIAFRIPNMLRDLFAEGALSQAFVPTFKASLKHDGRRDAYTLANRVAGTLLVIVGAIVLVAAILAPHIVAAIAGDFRKVPGKFQLTVLLTRIMLPFLLIVSLAAVAMGMLNSEDRYGAPALAPAVFNVVSILVGVGLYLAGVSGRWVAIGWSVGTVFGGLAQLGIQLPPLWRTGFRPRLRTDLAMRHPGVRRVGRLMLPAVGGLAAVQVNIFVNSMFATTERGAVSWLNYAFRFLHLPIGVFGVAIATVSTTRFSEAAADSDRKAMADHLMESLRLVAFLTVPATVGLILLGEPIIRLVFERGAFKASDTYATAQALQYYAVGLVAYSSVKVLAPAFYAVDRARIAVYASVTAVVANLAISIIFDPIYGYRVLALGTAVAAVVNFTVLYTMFAVRIARVHHARLFGYLVKVAVSAAAMGVVVWLSYRGIRLRMGTGGLTARAAGVLIPIALGAGIYATCAKLFRLPEMSYFLRRLRRRPTGGRRS